MTETAILAKEFSQEPKHVQAVIDLLDQGNTIPFIARYRKEMTGAMDDQLLREMSERLDYLRGLDKRRAEIEKALAEQGVGICIFPQTTYTPNRMLVKKVIVESARQVEYVLVWARKQRRSELVEEFINFVRDSLQEEKEHRQPYHMPAYEYIPPADTRYLE